MTLLVRDEIDVIDAMLDYHLSHGVDAIVATDNGSIDGTRDVLAAWARRGVLQLLDEAPSDFSQHRWVTRMAQLAYSIHRADWVLHADADELFVPRRHATLKEALAEVPTEVSVLQFGRHDFVPLDRPGKAPPQAEMLYRKQRSLNLAGRPLPSKVAHRAVPDCKITQGNHGVEGPGLVAAVQCHEIMVYHYPIRNYEQFVSKVKNGGSGYAKNRELPSGTGFHKRHWYDLLLRGELEAVYRAQYYYDDVRLQQSIERGELVLDRAAANTILASQRVGVPAEPTAGLTQRRRLISNRARPRILYILKNYPQLSQTYIKTELRALGARYEIKIIATSTPNYPDPETLPYIQLSHVDDIIDEARRFAPHVIHGHYLVQARIIRQVAEAIGRPFTIRAHSFDVLTPGTAPDKMPRYVAELPRLLNDELCLGVLAMPFARPVLVSAANVDAAKVIDSPPVVDFDYFYNRAANVGDIMNTGACIPKKAMGDFITVASRRRDLVFDLYAIGHGIEKIAQQNAQHGSPVNIRQPLPYAAMPAEYKKHRWLLYTACFALKTVGWPMAVVEAQASGVVVCVARVRPDLEEYVGGAGYLYNTLEEAETIVSGAPDESIRQRGFERASELDIRKQLPFLTNLWETAASHS